MRKIQLFGLMAAIFFVSCTNEPSKTSQSQADTTANGGLKEDSITYASDSLRGYVVYHTGTRERRPAVVVVPEWWGMNDYVKTRARQLAEMGYVAMAIDMYGNGRQAGNPEEAGKLAGPFYANPQLGQSRIDAAIARIKTYPQVDTSKIAAIGYCFGGSMVLNAARQGSDLDGVVSFHGSLSPAAALDKSKIKAQMLVCHGGADQFTSAKDSASFRKQLDSAGVSYIFNTYPNAKHAFSNPQADEYRKKFEGLDVAYNPEADKKSWEDMKEFLSRVFK